jgi:hypothetical protein
MALTMVLPDEAIVTGAVDEQGRPLKRDNGEDSNWLEYFGKAAGTGESPHGFVITLRDRLLGAHYHPVDQYQILMGSPSARYQKNPVPAMLVQYADAYVPYGPLYAEDPPMRFYTLRAEFTGEVLFMPKERDKLRWRGRRNRHKHFEHLEPAEIPAEGEIRVEPIFERDEDGLEALSIVAGPGATLTVPGTEHTSGQYVFVADGWVEYEGKKCGVETLGWQGRDESSTDLVAGPEGARVFVMRFPGPSTTEQHDLAAAVGTPA